jgi:hypothetical protein
MKNFGWHGYTSSGSHVMAVKEERNGCDTFKKTTPKGNLGVVIKLAY